MRLRKKIKEVEINLIIFINLIINLPNVCVLLKILHHKTLILEINLTNYSLLHTSQIQYQIKINYQ